jgi:hypothetical protein
MRVFLPPVDAVARCRRGLLLRRVTRLRPGPQWAALLGALGAFGLSAACSPSAAPSVVAHSLHLPADASTPCPDEPPSTPDWTGEVQSFAATVAGPDMESIQVDGSAPLVIPEVPAGTGRVVALFGLAQGTPVWRGVTRPLDVVAGADVAVDVLLARIADVSCARSTSQSTRAFHTATQLDDGTVLIVGGAEVIDDAGQANCPSCRRATATTKASTYDPKTGRFTPVEPDLTTPRMFHTAARLADGRVIVAGGTREALLRPVDGDTTFPIQPTAPLATIEVYDPVTRRFSPVGEDPGGARVFAAATTRSGGDVIITGGIPEMDTDRTLGNALSSTTICGGEPLGCRPGEPLARRRVGHALFNIEGDGVYAWGGSVELTPVDGIDGFHMERQGDDDATFRLVDVASMQATRNLFFATTSRYFGSRILAAGGLVRSTSGTFTFSLADGGGAAVFVFDRSSVASPFGGIATGRNAEEGRPAMQLSTPRFLASAAAMPDGETVIVAGGFSCATPEEPDNCDVELTPAIALERYDETTLTVAPIPVGGDNRALRAARGGLTATGIGDGTVLFVGGVTVDGGGAPATVGTAEVFADPETPPLAAALE